MAAKMDWHHYFGLFVEEFFQGTGYDVAIDEDLSRRKQLLDIIVVRKRGGRLGKRLPDGFGPLKPHNLISFKSYRQSFDAFTVKELVGHCINYCKQKGPNRKVPIPSSQIRMYGICARYPKRLAESLAALGQPLQVLSPGVYDIIWGTDRIRLLVIRELPESDANAMLLLFSADKRQVIGAQKRYDKIGTGEVSTLVERVLKRYKAEGLNMRINLESFMKRAKREIIEEATPEERLQGLPAEERMKGLPAEERMKGLPATERLRGLSVDEVLDALTPEAQQRLRDQLSRLPQP